MEENTTSTTPPTSSGGGNTVMFVIGALVLAGILGYVIFSSNKENTTPETATTESTETTEPTTDESTTPESTDAMTMQEDQAQGTPTDQQIKLQLDNTTAPGTAMNTTPPTGDVKEFNIEAGFPYYKPNLITVKKGDTVKIVMKSVDMQHDFNIDELGVKMPITKAGETNSVEFVAGTAGSFEYYCSVGQHRKNGQFGTLVVQE
jgi:heme/copper-type cytochrome/quinol oxidase subunit 2